MKINVESPLTRRGIAFQGKGIDTYNIIKGYKDGYNIDVSEYFKDIDIVYIMTCPDTGYQFYYPFSVAGTQELYEKLQSFEWYYMPWKWENDITSSLLSRKYKVLEIGCAKGDFLERIKDKVQSVTGLELNSKAAEVARKKGLEVFLDPVQEHALQRPEYYDVVCSFQVMEHISDPYSVFNAQIDTLKRGGFLLVAVPNQDSFVKFAWKENVMNMPPHHMGLWTEHAFREMCKFFPLKLDKVYFEPLQLYHVDWYYNVFLNRLGNGLVSKFFDLLFGKIMKFFLKLFRKNIKGHTILAVFQKQ